MKGFEEEERLGPLYANNVYEYHAGNVYLISDGQDVSAAEYFSEVVLLGTDPSGRDVFFTTSDALVGQDTDTNSMFTMRGSVVVFPRRSLRPNVTAMRVRAR